MIGRALVAQADALPRADGRGGLPLRDASVDLVLFSPPFWNLRDYGVPGQLGNEPTRQQFLEHLWAVTAECMRVMKPTASLFVELGDSYDSGTTSARVNPGTVKDGQGKGWKQDTPRLSLGRPKSLNLTPQRYAIGCVDQLGLTLRAEIIWSHVNGLPESVRDRVRQAHSRIYHFTLGPRYYAAVDEVREPHQPGTWARGQYPATKAFSARNGDGAVVDGGEVPWEGPNPLGKLPGSVWAIASEPLDLPGYFVLQDGRLLDFLAPQRGGARPRPNGHHPGLFDADAYRELVAAGDGPAWRWSRATGVTSSPWPQTDGGLQLRVAASHYAAFPSRLPELIVRGWSPSGICLECGEGCWPVVDRQAKPHWKGGNTGYDGIGRGDLDGMSYGATERERFNYEATILGYACACTPFTDHPGTGERTPRRDWTPGLKANPHGAPASHQLGEYQPVGPWREYHLAGFKAPPTRPAVVLDLFGGVGTSAMVARALGRIGLSFDLSFPYSRAARWRVTSDHAAKAISRTNLERQGSLL